MMMCSLIKATSGADDGKMMIRKGKLKGLKEKPASLSFSPQQISYKFTWD
jgi:hypothetical protein